jgi:hypothetical protein
MFSFNVAFLGFPSCSSLEWKPVRPFNSLVCAPIERRLKSANRSRKKRSVWGRICLQWGQKVREAGAYTTLHDERSNGGHSFIDIEISRSLCGCGRGNAAPLVLLKPHNKTRGLPAAPLCERHTSAGDVRVRWPMRQSCCLELDLSDLFSVFLSFFHVSFAVNFWRRASRAGETSVDCGRRMRLLESTGGALNCARCC